MADFVTLGLPSIAMERWGGKEPLTAPTPPPPTAPAEKPVVQQNQILINLQGAEPEGFQNDLQYMSLAQLGREVSPAEWIELRRRARFGDPRFLYASYDEMLRQGVSTQFDKLVERMTSARAVWEVNPAKFETDEWDGDPDAKVAREAREYVQDQMGRHLPAYNRAAAWARAYGISGAWQRVEPLGDVTGKRDYLAAVTPVEPRRFKLEPVTGKLLIQLDPRAFKFVPVEPYVAAGSLVIFDVDPSRPLDQRGKFFESIIPWSASQYGSRWWSKFMELYGIPFRTGTYPAGTSGNTKAKREIEGVLEKAGARGWAAMPEGTRIEFASVLAEAAGGAPHEMYLEFQKKCMSEIWFGHAQGSGVQGDANSEASSDQAAASGGEMVNSYLTQTAGQLARGPVFALVGNNFGWRFARHFCPSLSLQENRAEAVQQLLALALGIVKMGAGHRVDADDLIRRFNLKIVRKGGEALADSLNGGGKPEPGAEEPGQEIGKPEALPKKTKQKLSLVFGDETIRELEAVALRTVKGSGQPILQRYADVIEHATKDNATLGQLSARIDRAARERGAGTAEVAEHLAAIMANVTLKQMAEQVA